MVNCFLAMEEVLEKKRRRKPFPAKDGVFIPVVDKRTTKKAEQLVPFHFKKGQSGNPNGRPKGQTMKDFAREFLANMEPQDKKRWLAGLPPEIVWRMAEGNPHNTADVSSTVREVVALGEEDKKRIEALFPPHELLEP